MTLEQELYALSCGAWLRPPTIRAIPTCQS
jgi:hypothetical protein